MSENPHPLSLKWRLLLCVVAGVAVTIITILSQWADDGAAYSWPVRRTRSFLDHTRDDVEQYRKEHGKLPDTLADLEEVGYLKDGWRRPFQYVPHGDTYELNFCKVNFDTRIQGHFDDTGRG
jgi:hypothetical protein